MKYCAPHVKNSILAQGFARKGEIFISSFFCGFVSIRVSWDWDPSFPLKTHSLFLCKKSAFS